MFSSGHVLIIKGIFWVQYPFKLIQLVFFFPFSLIYQKKKRIILTFKTKKKDKGKWDQLLADVLGSLTNNKIKNLFKIVVSHF